MLVYRITQTKYASGLVAPGISGRWNSEGQKMIYSGCSISLACLENLAHRSGSSLNVGNFSISTINIPDNILIEEVLIDDLINVSSEWHVVSNYFLTQKIGDNWLEALSAPVLKVPSAIVPSECNYLLNPYHPDFSNIKIVSVMQYRFDPRLKMENPNK